MFQRSHETHCSLCDRLYLCLRGQSNQVCTAENIMVLVTFYFWLYTEMETMM